MTTIRRKGFTLVELLVVIAIVTILATFLIAGLLPQKEKALRSNTQTMIESIKTALDQYYSEFHDYPPDGYDMEPGWKTNWTGVLPGNPGIKLGSKNFVYYGSGTLIYFLCYPITNITIIGADQGVPDPRNVRKNPCNKGGAFLTTLRRENFSVTFYDSNFDIAIHPGMAGYQAAWSRCEIVDAYLWPIHYDKVGDAKDTVRFQKDRFSGANGRLAHSDQKYYDDFVAPRIIDESQLNYCQGNIHVNTSSIEHADPRGVVPDKTCGCFVDTPPGGSEPRPRNQGNCDIWSHGKFWRNGTTSITNWGLGNN